MGCACAGNLGHGYVWQIHGVHEQLFRAAQHCGCTEGVLVPGSAQGCWIRLTFPACLALLLPCTPLCVPLLTTFRAPAHPARSLPPCLPAESCGPGEGDQRDGGNQQGHHLAGAQVSAALCVPCFACMRWRGIAYVCVVCRSMWWHGVLACLLARALQTAPPACSTPVYCTAQGRAAASLCCLCACIHSLPYPSPQRETTGAAGTL